MRHQRRSPSSMPASTAASSCRAIPGTTRPGRCSTADTTSARRSSSAPAARMTSSGRSRTRRIPDSSSPCGAAVTAAPVTAAPTAGSSSIWRICARSTSTSRGAPRGSGPGLTAGEYTVAAGAHGLATGFGDAGTVGIGGITLGGGVGFLVRKYGLTIDDLLAADIVTADGRVRRVDAETEPDLFWAIRGGGGNFGVVTRLPLPAASRRHGGGRDAVPARRRPT